jgi:hypothetical protein
MAIRNKYFPGTSVSRYLPPGEHSWDSEVYQSGKPVLDAELNLSQEVRSHLEGLIQQREAPSGWLRGPIPSENTSDFTFLPPGDPNFAVNTFWMKKRTAMVAGMPLEVEFTDTDLPGLNKIQLDPATVYEGTPPSVKRTDFVFLEVFRTLVQPPMVATATVQVVSPVALADGDTLTIGGVALTARNAAPGVNEFLIDAADSIITAGNIRDAINDVANGFTAICTAELDATVPDQVNLRAVPAGTLGNAVTLATSNAPAFDPNPLPANFSGGTNPTPNAYPSQGALYRYGNVLSPASTNLVNNMIDPTVDTETAARVQIQYRIRATGAAQGVNFKTEDVGFSNTQVLDLGSTGSDVTDYPFMPADGTTTPVAPVVSSPALYKTVDNGLWIAGDGTQASATALGTVDGFVYAIPIGFVFRRNDAYAGQTAPFTPGAGNGFAPLTNTNGALPSTHVAWLNPSLGWNIGVDLSDRPDGLFHDVIVDTDLMDLRKQVTPGGIDLKAELERQMTLLLDNSMSTWAIDGADKQDLGDGSGDVSWRFLVCNEIGRGTGAGGNPANGSGDTTRGVTVANFDHIRRRFADQAVVERRIFPVTPNMNQPGIVVTKAAVANGWNSEDVITIDLSVLAATGLGDWLDASRSIPAPGGEVNDYWPPGTTITAVLSAMHDDGNFTASTDPTLQVNTVIGLGTDVVAIRLGENAQPITGGIDPTAPGYPYPNPMFYVGSGGVDNGSRRRVFIELEITYPCGEGTTDTPYLYLDPKDQIPTALAPDPNVWEEGTLIENNTAYRPLDMQAIYTPRWREGYRETVLEYAAGSEVPGAPMTGTPITENGVVGWNWSVAGQETMGIVSRNNQTLIMSRRICGQTITGVAHPNVTDMNDTLPRDVNQNTTEYGSSSRRLAIDTTGPNGPLSGIETLCNVEYFAQDPIPNYGPTGTGYQISVYYRSAAPQTLGVREGATAAWALPSTLTVEPLVMSRDLWTGQVSVGGQDLPYPYLNPSDQIPVCADVSGADFPGEWMLSALAEVSIGDFAADVGMLNLHQLVAVDPNQPFTFTDRAVDAEFRAQYKVADPNTYRPTAMAQPMSNLVTHKSWMPFLARATEDSTLWRKDEVILLVVSRYGLLDDVNGVAFADTVANNTTCVALYRTQGILLLASE